MRQHILASTRTARACAWLLACAAVIGLAGCSGADSNLQQFIRHVEQEPGGRVEPLPEVKPYETFVYNDQNLRSPFVPSQPHGFNVVRPNSKRPRQYLEQFSLDTLKMVGSLQIAGQTYGLVQTKDGIVHRVTVGNYMGQNDGRITKITPSKIDLTEIVPDGLGGFMKRPAALGLSQ
ncbi:MAG TPA: pilus assembly protein PilP [Steroidobacteraceae bacterium]|nr:pilus assembly protein PilP [Steroidobacteraceae bacterium]